MKGHCNEQFKKRALILQYESFSGYDFLEQTNSFAICFMHNITQNDVEAIKNLSKSKTLKDGDFIGHEYLEIDWSEYHKINDIFNAILELGISFQTTGKIKIYFKGGVDKIFTDEIREHKTISLVNEYLSRDLLSCLDVRIFKIWNWKTKEGQECCKMLRKKVDKKEPNYNSKNNYLKWNIFKNCDFKTLPEEEEDCYICFENKANTMVLPCEHIVVCRDCSEKLRNTNDKDVCVKCQNKITHIF